MKKKNENRFAAYSAAKIPKIDAFIKGFYSAKIHRAPHPLLKKIYKDISEYVLRDGKRIRPLLLLATREGYSGDKAPAASALKLAGVIEIMHSLLLVQDDIIDRSPLRRGGKAMHILAAENYAPLKSNHAPGEDTAAIIADIMFSNAVEIIGSSPASPEIKDSFLMMFSRTYEMTALGQILDIINGNPAELTENSSSALEISSYKTAYYTIYYPMAMGFALSGAASARETGMIKKFALPLGLAFQIRDDLLGVFGRSADTGKPSDSDIAEGKLTLLIQNTVDLLPPHKRKKFISLFTSNEKRRGSAAEIRGMIEESGAVEKTAESKKNYIRQSRKALAALSISIKYKKLLEDFITLIEK